MYKDLKLVNLIFIPKEENGIKFNIVKFYIFLRTKFIVTFKIHFERSPLWCLPAHVDRID